MTTIFKSKNVKFTHMPGPMQFKLEPGKLYQMIMDTYWCSKADKSVPTIVFNRVVFLYLGVNSSQQWKLHHAPGWIQEHAQADSEFCEILLPNGIIVGQWISDLALVMAGDNQAPSTFDNWCTSCLT